MPGGFLLTEELFDARSLEMRQSLGRLLTARVVNTQPLDKKMGGEDLGLKVQQCDLC